MESLSPFLLIVMVVGFTIFDSFVAETPKNKRTMGIHNIDPSATFFFILLRKKET